MKFPLWLWILIGLFVLAGCIGLCFEFFCGSKILSSISHFALIVTLAVLIIYTYSNYLLAKKAWMASASFHIKPILTNPLHYEFVVHSYCNLSLEIWCKLNATYKGYKFFLKGFYNEESSIRLQPFTEFYGHFNIKDFVTKEGLHLEDVGNGKIDLKKFLNLNIEFWYFPIGSKIKTTNPIQPYHFDFNSRKLILDF